MKIECVFPTRRDVLDVLRRAFGRHTRGVQGWWDQNAKKLGPEKVLALLLPVWEAGRARAANIGR